MRTSTRGFLLLTAGICLFLSTALRADEKSAVREAGPEDGINCCSSDAQFLFHHSEVLVTTGRAGIFKSDQRGEEWHRSMLGLVGPDGVSPFVDAICQSPSRPRVVYAITGRLNPSFTSPFQGLFSSDDFGETWKRRAEIPEGTGNVLDFCAVDPDDPLTVYLLDSDPSDLIGRLRKTTDGGRTLQLVGDLPELFFPNVLRTAPGVVYAGDFEQGLFASTDGGETFHTVPLPAPITFLSTLIVSPDGHVILASGLDDETFKSFLVRSTDGGASFSPVDGLLASIASISGMFDPTEPSRVYVSYGEIFVSNDGGQTFEPCPTATDVPLVGFARGLGVDERGSVYFDNAPGIFRSDDGGREFRSVMNGFRASSVQDLAFDANGQLLAGVLHTMVVFRQTAGRAFEPIGRAVQTPPFALVDAASVAGSPADANTILVATSKAGLFRTADGGLTWTTPAVPDPQAAYSNSRMLFAGDSRVYLVTPTSPSGLYRSDDAGQTFERISPGMRLGAIAVDPANPDVLYVGTFNDDAGLFKSIDGGVTLHSLVQAGQFTAIVVDRRDPQVVYAAERFGGVIRSLDGGLTFTRVNKGLAGAGVHGLVQDGDGTLFAWVREGGLFASHNAASTWHAVDTGEALQRSAIEAGRGSLVADPRHPGRVYLGNAGVIRIDDGDDRHDQ